MPRSVKEWQGKTPDTRIPDRVKLRVWEKWGGRCHITGMKIRPGDKWEIDHVKPLILGGENRESNLAPVLTFAHKAKTKEEKATKSKVARVRGKNIGLKEKKPWNTKYRKKMDGSVVPRD